MIRNIIRPLPLFMAARSMGKLQCVRFFNTKKQYWYPKKTVAKEENLGSIIVKNDNLRFDTSDYELNFYPFHPDVIKKNTNFYEINKLSSVFALNFVPKSQSGNQNSSEMKQNWDNRKSIAFRFNQLGKFLQVNSNEAGEWSLVVDRTYKEKTKVKTLKIKNTKKSQFFDIVLEENSSDSQWKIETKISYSEFSLFQFLLKESLYDLSGMKLMFDLRRNEELAKMTEKDKSDVEKQSLFKGYDNRDDVV